MLKFKSLKTKLSLSYIIIVVIISAFFSLIFTFLLNAYYYGNIEQTLKDRIASTVEMYANIPGIRPLDSKAKFLIENNTAPEYVDAQIITTSGKILESSTNQTGGEAINSPDFKKALAGEISIWKGKDIENSDSLISVSAPLYSGREVSGVIRFVSSVAEVDSVVNTYRAYIYLLAFLSILVSLFISRFMASNVLYPIYQLRTVADHFAIGDFEKKAQKFSNDELGELADTFNYMAIEIKKTEQLKNDFISSISHEIRTPLTSIMAWSETLQNSNFDEESNMGIEIIAKESKRLTGLVENLLDFSKLEAGAVEIDKANFDLKDLVIKTISQISILGKNKKIQIKFYSKSGRYIYFGDRNRIKQVLLNLLDNAVKHSYENSSIFISLEKKADKIIIRIKDQGDGIPTFHISDVTKMFYKADDTKPGSGIGLAVSKKILELHDAKLELLNLEQGGVQAEITFNL